MFVCLSFEELNGRWRTFQNLCHYAVCICWDRMRLWQLSVNRAVPRWAQSVLICDKVIPRLSPLCSALSITMRHMLRVFDHKDTGKT